MYSFWEVPRIYTCAGEFQKCSNAYGGVETAMSIPTTEIVLQAHPSLKWCTSCVMDSDVKEIEKKLVEFIDIVF